MTVMLGSIVLSDHLILDGLESAPGVAYSARRTLGGRLAVQIGPTLVKGRTLTLVAENHLTMAQISAIKDIEAKGLSVDLSHHRGSFRVVVTAVDVEPTVAYADPDLNDWYSGTITMLEV